jgi:nucleoside permease NupC
MPKKKKHNHDKTQRENREEGEKENMDGGGTSDCTGTSTVVQVESGIVAWLSLVVVGGSITGVLGEWEGMC